MNPYMIYENNLQSHKITRSYPNNFPETGNCAYFEIINFYFLEFHYLKTIRDRVL